MGYPHAHSNINVVTAGAVTMPCSATNTMVTESNINLEQPTHSAIQIQISTTRQVTPQENLSVNPLQQLKQTNRNILSHPVTPIKVKVFQKLLKGYHDAQYLISGFRDGFRLGYNGPREASVASNLKSCRDLPEVVADKIQKEVSLGRIKGPFLDRPMSDLRISPIGVVPKKVPGQYRLIHHLSHPKGSSVNDFIDKAFSSVHYASFDDAIAKVLILGKDCLMSKTDIDSAFRLLPVHHKDHNLLGFQFNGDFTMTAHYLWAPAPPVVYFPVSLAPYNGWLNRNWGFAIWSIFWMIFCSLVQQGLPCVMPIWTTLFPFVQTWGYQSKRKKLNVLLHA